MNKNRCFYLRLCTKTEQCERLASCKKTDTNKKEQHERGPRQFEEKCGDEIFRSKLEYQNRSLTS